MDRPYVSLSNLTTFWSAVKQYIDNTGGGGGINPEIEAIVQELSTKLDTEITDRSDADTELNRLINVINTYTVNAQPISESPVLSGVDIPYSSDADGVSVYDKVNSIDQKVDEIDGYTVNSKPISSNPTLTGNDITLGVSVGDNTNYPTTTKVASAIQKLRETIAGLGQVLEFKGKFDSLPAVTGYENGDVVIVNNKEYILYNSAWEELGDVSELSQDVSTIKSSYVKSITCEGANGVTVTPTTASNGDVSIKVDALTLNQKFANYLPLTGGRLEGPSSALFTLNNSNSVNNESGIRFELSNESVGWVGYTSGHGTYLYTYEGPHSMGIKGDGTGFIDSNVIMHSGNYSSYALPLSGGTMTGNIAYQGTKNVYEMIRFIDNTVDTAGNGISIGGGGATIIGGGESAVVAQRLLSTGGDERMIICNDADIEFFSNCQSGIGSRKTMTFNTSGQLIASNFVTNSDRRLKTNIHEISSDKLSNSLNINFVEFDYKDNDKHSAGHVAQEVKEVLPEFVHGNESETEHLSIDYTGLHSVQIKALKDEINLLKKENEELRKSNNELNTRVEKLERLIEKLI